MRPLFLRAAAFLTIAIAVATPLFVAPYGLDPFRLPKTVLLRVGGLAVLWLLAVAVARKEIPIRQVFHWGRIEDRAVAGIVAATVVSSVFSTLPSASLKSVVTVLALLGMFLTSRIAVRAQPYVRWMMIPACLIAVLAFFARTSGWSPWTVIWTDLDPTSQRLLGSATLLGNSNDVGCFLAFWTVVFLIQGSTSVKMKVLFGLALLAGLMSSVSLTAVLAALAGIGTQLVGLGEKRRSARIVAIASLAVILVASGLALSNQLANLDRAPGAPLERATSHRWGSWLAGLSIGAQHPLVGVGPGAFGKHFSDARVSVANRYLGFFSTDHPSTFFSEAHSDYIEIFAETGLPGLIVFAGTLTLLIRRPSTRAGAVTLAVLALGSFPLQLASFLVPAVVWFGSHLREPE